MNISGKVKLINETKEYGSNGFRKREIVLTTQEQYPQNILVEFIQDRTNLLDAFNVGDLVKIDINLRGREWTNDKGEIKYFNSIQGWRIEKVEDDFESQLPPLPTKEDSIAGYSGILSSDIDSNGNELGTTDLIRRRWLDNNFYVLNASVDYNSKNLNLNFNSFYSSYSGDHFGEIIWARTFSQNGKIRDRYYEGNGKKKDFSVFSKASFNLGEKAEIYTDLQFRKVNYKTSGITSDLVNMILDKEYNFFNPKFGASYKFKPNSMLYFSYARANREPSRSDYESNLSIKPEELNDLELGWRFRNEKIKLNINSYYMLYSNQLVLTGELDDVGTPIRTNSGNSYRLGIEIDNFLKLSEKTSFQTNLTLSSNKNKEIISKVNGEIYNYGKTNISFSPNLIASNIFSYMPNEYTTLSLLSKYVGDQYMSNNDSKNSMLESYFINDLNFNYQIKTNKLFDSIIFSALINNLFDIEYISNGYYYTYDDTWSNPGEVVTLDGAGYYPQATRNFLFGVSLKF